ncbi:MAG: DNA-binding protein [Gemmatimonadetes bacterium]|nr:DNA-binding protein [Gemmatimonadota bacterium]
MLYLLDANVLIDAGRDYYPLEMVPEFWDWLEYHGTIGAIKLPLEIYEEVCDGNDPLAEWLRRPHVKGAVVLAEEVDAAIVARVVAEGYAPDLTDDEVIKIGRDPFLAAYSLVDPADRCIVTTEGSRPTRQRANRHLPDVCRGFSISVCNTFELTRRLAFKTSWRRPPD